MGEGESAPVPRGSVHQGKEKVKEQRGVEKEKEKGRRKYATLSGRTSRILQDITGRNVESAKGMAEVGREIGMPMSLAGGKKRKLVVRGVSRTDVRAVEGVRKWCEVRS